MTTAATGGAASGAGSVVAGASRAGGSRAAGDTRDRDTSGLGWLSTRSGVLTLAALALPFLVLFGRWFATQHKLSVWQPEDWGHAWLVPFISGYLLWQRRDKIREARARVFWPALPAVLLGLASYRLFSLDQAVNFHMGQGLALVLTVFGVVLLLAGPQVTRWAFLPVAFLVFGITVAERIMQDLTFQLQLIASQGSWVMLSVIGAGLGFRAELMGGNIIEVITASGEVHPLNVAEACSGMRMVVAFYALAVAVALVACRMWWQRAATMLLAGPVAVFMNMVRVTTLGLLTLVDPDLAAGQAHTVIGTILLVPSLLTFLGIVWALNKVVEPAGEGSVAGSAAASGAGSGVGSGVGSGSGSGAPAGKAAAVRKVRRVRTAPSAGADAASGGASDGAPDGVSGGGAS